MATADVTKPKEKFIDANEYFEMALSNRRYQRVDQPSSGIYGLADPITGERFFVHQKQLLAASLGSRRAANGSSEAFA